MKYAVFCIRYETGGKWGMNSLYTGRHWSVRKKQAEEIHALVREAIAAQIENPALFTKPVEVRISFNDRLDIDNHGYLAKLIIDGMKGILIKDDSRRYVDSMTLQFHEVRREEIIVEVIT